MLALRLIYSVCEESQIKNNFFGTKNKIVCHAFVALFAGMVSNVFFSVVVERFVFNCWRFFLSLGTVFAPVEKGSLAEYINIKVLISVFQSFD